MHSNKLMAKPCDISEASQAIFEDKKISKECFYSAIKKSPNYKRLMYRRALEIYMDDLDNLDDVFGAGFAADGLIMEIDKIESL